MGKILQPSRKAYLDIIEKLRAGGAEAIILGCTEIGLLVKPEDASLPVFDTTLVHALAAVDVALGKASIQDYLP